MQTFLKKLVDHIWETHADNLGDLCIVTPNRRAGLFIRKYITDKIRKPTWAPRILSIEDFINKISGLTICDHLTLLFEFYTVYRTLEKEKADEPDAFFSWAPALLRDFDDIDNALAEPGKLYAFLEDIRYIDTWNPDGRELTDFQKNYLSFIKKLKTYHRELKEHLTGKNLAWQGLSSRLAAQKLSAEKHDIPWRHVVFAGFNALSQAEETIIGTLLKKQTATYIPDTDPFYIDDPDHEAGRFIRKYHKLFDPKTMEAGEDGFHDDKKNIRILGVAKNVNQARLAGNLLQNEPGLSTDENTAVVLANENLLIPMLNTLPANIGSLNVTMGYPLTKTNMFSFFDALFRLQLRAILPGRDKNNQFAFYHKDLLALLSHSNSSLLWDLKKGDEKTTAMLKKLNASNQSFITFDELAGMSEEAHIFKDAFSFMNTNWQNDPQKAFSDMIRLTEKFDRLYREKAGKQGGDIIQTPFFVDFESLYYFGKIFRQVLNLLNGYPFLGSVRTLYKLFRQTTSETSLSFTGEPLEGLQIMGMLETRTLDFDHVILLSANENILPRPKSSYSFIPYEVRKSFGLRLYLDQDAIYAYHFYRLLQRAKNIYLIYNTETQDVGSSEKSRFITQLQYELPIYNPRVHIHEEIVSLPPPLDTGDHAIIIRKTPDILQRLDEISEKGFSPSALSTYINCPLQFYLDRLARIDEAEEVEETLEARTIGSVAHGVLEKLFQPHIGQVLRKKHISAMQEQLEATLNNEFSKEYKGGDTTRGKNLLLYHLTLRYLENILKAEAKAIERAAANNETITILALEKELQATITLHEGSDKEKTVRLKGLADRIDRKGRVIRVIDYKTGRIGPYELSFKEWNTPFSKSDKAKNFQLLFYAYMYSRMNDLETDIEPGILSLRSPAKGLQTMSHPGGEGILKKDDIQAFEEELKSLLVELLDPEVPFAQTDDIGNCQYCLFSKMCRRF
ncbi:MAG: PD-(D/E)XK nuclease family protein [Bacteroidia bacterium]|nr:MAG: PD-(D/E)XK nuclease family protein [Bacteroidia bacterium]